MKLLNILQGRARELGVKLQFQTEIDDPQPFMAEYDMVLAADGLNSTPDIGPGGRRARGPVMRGLVFPTTVSANPRTDAPLCHPQGRRST
jgi:hypothetical protein